MALDFRVNPPVPAQGQMPKAGQTTEYLDEDGTLYTFWLTWVGDIVPGNRRRVKVSGYRVNNGHGYAGETTWH